MRLAVIGLGSNSTKLIVADAGAGSVRPVLRDRAETRLLMRMRGDGIPKDAMLIAAMDVTRLAIRAREAGAERIRLIATSATRDAVNRADFLELLEAASGLRAEVLSGEDEARLSFLGASGGGYCGVLDIGAGSTEFAVGDGRDLRSASAQIGAARLAREFPDPSDPKAIAIAREAAQAAWTSLGVAKSPARWYGVGGTLACLSSVDLRLPAYDRDATDGHALTRDAVERWARDLCAMDAQARAAVSGMQPGREGIIAQGALILLSAMEAAGMDAIIARDRTNLDGLLAEMAGEIPTLSS